MKWYAYLLVLLLISAQADDALAAAPVLPSAPLADDNDNYLPAQRRPQEEQSATRQRPIFFRMKPVTGNSSVVRRGVPSELDQTVPFTPPPLYVFMSLQI